MRHYSRRPKKANERFPFLRGKRLGKSFAGARAIPSSNGADRRREGRNVVRARYAGTVSKSHAAIPTIAALSPVNFSCFGQMAVRPVAAASRATRSR